MKGGQKLFSSFIQLVKTSSVPMSSHTHTHTPSVTYSVSCRQQWKSDPSEVLV